jgi:purine-binding chemotaxis protein CheW
MADPARSSQRPLLWFLMGYAVLPQAPDFPGSLALWFIPNRNHTLMRQHAGEYLSFQLGGEQYGIDILKVQEIRGYEAPTRIANAPSFILGVLNLRGVIVPIWDMRIKLRMDRADYDSHTVTIVLNVGERVIGLVVDAVQDVVALKAEDIKPAPEFSSTLASQHLIGIATLEQAEAARMLILMDIEQFIAGADTGELASTDLAV